MPQLTATTVAAQPVPGEGEAITKVVGATGHLLDECRPTASGVSVTGRIEPPRHQVPPMRATCSISVHPGGSFLVADVLVVVPQGFQGVRVQQPYEQITLPPPYNHVGTSGQTSVEVIAWEFVVTADGALPVAARTVANMKGADAMAPEWEWTGSTWLGPGRTRCGGLATGSGGGPDPMIEFVSVCG